MVNKRVVESPRYSDWLGEGLSPDTVRKLRDGLTRERDGSGRLELEGLTDAGMEEVAGLCRRLGIEVHWRPPAVTVEDFCDDPDRVLDWVLAHGQPVELSYGEHTLRVVAG